MTESFNKPPDPLLGEMFTFLRRDAHIFIALFISISLKYDLDNGLTLHIESLVYGTSMYKLMGLYIFYKYPTDLYINLFDF